MADRNLFIDLLRKVITSDGEGKHLIRTSDTLGGLANDMEEISASDDTELLNVIGFKALADGIIKVETPGGTRTIQVFEGDLEPSIITKFYATDSDTISIRVYKS
jgi:hypothetical protein